MPEIGATLREARMRARIDISEIESETKIRAKYLRALENEEWDLLPGPTYVKSFLRTYAEALGLDARLLVEEYKLRHERLPENEQPRPIGAAAAGRRRPDPQGVPPWMVIGLVVVLLLAGLFALGKLTGDDGGSDTTVVATTPTATTRTSSTRSTTTASNTAKKTKRKTTSKYVRLTLTATAGVYVCLEGAGNRTLVPGETLSAGESRGPFRSSSYTINLGNNGVRLRINGKTVTLPSSSSALGYRITRKGRTTLPEGQRPVCGP